MLSNEGSAIAALVGPPGADAAAGVSPNLAIFNPSMTDMLPVTLPSSATALASGANGNFAAILAGTPPKEVMVDSVTGAVADSPVGAGPGAGGRRGSLCDGASANVDL